MTRIVQIFILGGMLALFSACNPELVFEQYKTIPDQSWNKDSTLVFEIVVNDTISNHNLYLCVRNDVNYSFSNLWLFVTVEQPNGESFSDKFEITLANPAGKWLGKGFGGVKTSEALFRSNIFFPVSGSYIISVQQGMREDVLSGISDVGVRIERVGN